VKRGGKLSAPAPNTLQAGGFNVYNPSAAYKQADETFELLRRIDQNTAREFLDVEAILEDEQPTVV